MGGSTHLDQILDSLEIKYNASSKIKIHDDYIERQMAQTESAETQKFLMPIWRLRSSFQDALGPIQESTVNNVLGSPMMRSAAKAIREGRIEDPVIDFVLIETEKCITNYAKYIRRLRQLYNSTSYIFNTIRHHKIDILDDYADFHNHDPIATRGHYNRIVYVLEMSIVMGESIRDAIQSAYRVMKVAEENVEMVLSCYQSIFNIKQLEAKAMAAALQGQKKKKNHGMKTDLAADTSLFSWLFENPRNDWSITTDTANNIKISKITSKINQNDLDSDSEIIPVPARTLTRIKLPENYGIKTKMTNSSANCSTIIQKHKTEAEPRKLSNNLKQPISTSPKPKPLIKSPSKSQNNLENRPKLVVFSNHPSVSSDSSATVFGDSIKYAAGSSTAKMIWKSNQDPKRSNNNSSSTSRVENLSIRHPLSASTSKNKNVSIKSKVNVNTKAPTAAVQSLPAAVAERTKSNTKIKPKSSKPAFRF